MSKIKDKEKPSLKRFRCSKLEPHDGSRCFSPDAALGLNNEFVRQRQNKINVKACLLLVHDGQNDM